MTEEPTRPNLGSHSLASARRVRWREDLEVVRQLFREYRQWLYDHRDTAAGSESSVKAGLAMVDGLIRNLPGDYGPPDGEVLLWYEDQSLVACGALRRIEPGVGEIKRIHVRPDYRGKEFGPPFVRALISRAHELGFERLQVDTLSTMTAAIEFYQELGFRPIPAFWPHPAAGARFFECRIIE